jgi:hypothetical protein
VVELIHGTAWNARRPDLHRGRTGALGLRRDSRTGAYVAVSVIESRAE